MNINASSPSDLAVSGIKDWGDLKGKPLRVWFNQTYGTNYWIVKMVQENPDNIPVHVITTSDRAESPVLLAGNEAYLEPTRSDLNGDSYVDWALKFCKENDIHVFVPMREISEIAGRADEFRALGVAVLTSPKESIDLLEDKNLAYISARDNGIPVPPWRVASTRADFLDAYESLLDETENEVTICFKPVQGVGGQGYRKITTKEPSVKDLLAGPGHVVNLNTVLDIFQREEDQGDVLPEFMLMPYLAEPETSVDCLSDINGNVLIAIPRSKSGKFRTISTESQASIEIAEQMVKTYSLGYLTNTQTRFWKGEAVLLETNTRISGGMYASPMAGVNMPWEGIKLALFGNTSGFNEVTLGARYSSVPQLIRVDGLAVPELYI